MKRAFLLVFFFSIFLVGGCIKKSFSADALMMDAAAFDTTIQNKPIRLFTARNDNGMIAQFTNYGARVVSIIIPDKLGNPTDVLLGYESIQGYINSRDRFAGPIVGRFGNRIAKGKFSIDGNECQLQTNEGENQLHGGSQGFYEQIWNGRQYKNDDGEDVVEMTYHSADGEQGYPGNLDVKVLYTLKKDNALQIEYSATTDKATPVNLTWHPYINLHGTTAKSTNTHILWVDADGYTPTDQELIPTGEIASVEATPMDFRTKHLIGDRNSDVGYDMNFVLNKKGEGLQLAATMYEPENGIQMEIFTDQPGLQFYSGPAMNGRDCGKRGDILRPFSGVALETQHFPDSPNQSAFPSTILRPGGEYRHYSVYKFGVER